MALINSLPFLIEDVPPVPGTIKADYEDFQVEELPLYAPSGQGDHVYFTVEKRGLTTHQAVRDVARALGINPRDIGVAGNKDARGVTRQMMSVEHVAPTRIEALTIPRLSILQVTRHRNKLRTGHLLGNRFTIKLRDTDITRVADVEKVLNRLHQRGVPNYYGPQRFGNRGDTWQVGRALLKGDYQAAAGIIAGTPGPADIGEIAEARALFDRGEFQASAARWPSGFQECVALSRAMHRFKGNAQKAVQSLHKKTIGLYVSAFQSELFNRVVALRIKELDIIKEGDVAWKHENGAAFLVETPEADQPRADRFEISPTGPLFGKKMKAPAHAVADLEARILESSGISLDALPKKGPLRCQGGRRPLRFRPESPGVKTGRDDRGPFLELSVALRAGCYATSLLREICKGDLVSATGC
jgi:tRNA pseudouridine13 synthase